MVFTWAQFAGEGGRSRVNRPDNADGARGLAWCQDMSRGFSVFLQLSPNSGSKSLLCPSPEFLAVSL